MKESGEKVAAQWCGNKLFIIAGNAARKQVSVNVTLMQTSKHLNTELSNDFLLPNKMFKK